MDLTSVVTITAPANVDGRGEIAQINGSPSATHFVGHLWDASGFDGASVRTSMDPIPEGHGAVFGSFYYGPRSFTLEIVLARKATWITSMERRDKLYRAFDAMGEDGLLSWIETGSSEAKTLLFRREQPPRGPDKEGKVLLAGIAEDPRMYAPTIKTGSPITNAGTANSPPTFTFTPSGNGTVILTNTTAGLGSPAVTLTVGTGFLATGSAVTVDFKTKTVTQGGVVKNHAVSFPSSTWWEVVPGVNNWSRTGTATLSTAAAIAMQDAFI